GRRELSTPLRQVPVTPQTASELVRLALRPADADSDADSDVGDEHDEHLSESLLERLEQCELFELTTAERLEVLRVLVHRLLDTDSLADRHRELCLRRDAIARDLKAQRKEEEAAATAAAAPQPAAAAAGAEAGHPESPAPAAPPADGADTSIGDGDDLASRTKRSRRNLEQARREREEREREKRERREKELEAERKALAEAALAREYQSLKAEAARVLRRAPLGRDRHHRRYWLLDSLPDGLYVEAGWADRQTTEYRVQPATDHHTSSDEDDQPLTVVQRRSLLEKDQTTVPEPAENRWFCYTTLPELEQLRAALALKGEREAALREALAAHDERLRTALAAKPEPVPEKTSLTEATPSAEPAKNTRTTPTKPETSAETGDVEAGAVKAPAEAGVDSDNKTDVKVEADANANTESVRESRTEPDEPRPRTDPEPEAEARVDSGAAGSAGAAAAADQEEAGGYQFLISTLKEDILGIEEELSAGWLGAVPEPAEWAERVLAAETADRLGAAVLECERHIRRDVLQGPLAAGGQRWADAVRACRTLSRLHVLVGLLDSAIRWDLSTAQKKCRVCRRRGEGAVALCAVCKQLYHCNCLRPALLEVPGAEWQCYGCRPVPPTPRHGRRQRARRYVDDEPLYEA
ncbi:tyrosine-protein kinase BAZ1B-like, partial [Amphibalanus amphitrite]|uniref:tyrosine-protein kinase BAZ1B-like n=1 Tax=Amphibalanus amphitrite TaxID=1232801 RepID=UPI001C90B989